jgi:hypothetical protein
MSGAGAAEWGRFLISMGVVTKRTDDDGRSTVTMRVEVEGDELAEHAFRFRRTVWTDDPDDLTSAMHYHVERLDDDDDTIADDRFAPSTRRVLAVLEHATDWLKVSEIGDQLADKATPLKKRTIQTALNELRDAGLADAHGTDQKGVPWSWRTPKEVGS